MVVHRATNSISEFDYMALQVAFKTIAGSFDVCLYLDYKQQWEEPASEKIPHTCYFLTNIFFLITEIKHNLAI